MPINRFAALAIGCLLAISGSQPAHAAVGFPDPLPLSPLESRMLADPVAGQFQQFTLIEAALVASGVDRADDLERYRQRYIEWRDQARQISEHEQSPGRRSEALFEFMHGEILTGGYDPRATELMRVFDDGTFNCASATVMFTALATDCGLIVHAVERPRHAMCAMVIDGQRIDVETTCPNWFQLTAAMRREAELAAIAHSRGIGRPTDPREIRPTELVAVIYYNRGVDLLRENRFAEAVSVNLRALALDAENETAHGNLLASINNWALAQCAHGDYRAATDLLAQGLDIAPDHEPFHANRRHVYRTWIQFLATAGRQLDALAVLAAARQSEPDSPVWSYWAVRLSR
ncbi:MAG TPA: tetratricopeptide repeat protein [Pirellulales bacterium]|jgi:tetratricopeptide (TPR) repeat protein|nr:tetratricopeptide repeat protein [Pirellulales bacterium]